METRLTNERVLADINRKRTLILIVFLVLILALIANAYLFWDYTNQARMVADAFNRCNVTELCTRQCIINNIVG